METIPNRLLPGNLVQTLAQQKEISREIILNRLFTYIQEHLKDLIDNDSVDCSTLLKENDSLTYADLKWLNTKLHPHYTLRTETKLVVSTQPVLQFPIFSTLLSSFLPKQQTVSEQIHLVLHVCTHPSTNAAPAVRVPGAVPVPLVAQNRAQAQEERKSNQ